MHEYNNLCLIWRIWLTEKDPVSVKVQTGQCHSLHNGGPSKLTHGVEEWPAMQTQQFQMWDLQGTLFTEMMWHLSDHKTGKGFVFIKPYEAIKAKVKVSHQVKHTKYDFPTTSLSKLVWFPLGVQWIWHWWELTRPTSNELSSHSIWPLWG